MKRKIKYQTNNKLHIIQGFTSAKAITLISLVITIIILIILAGVTINISVGQNGIFKRAKNVRETYLEQMAKEKLEIVLLELQAEKEGNSSYNEIEDVNKKITQNNMTIIGDIVSADGWQFQIDRSTPKVIASLGKGEQEKQIEISVSQEVRNDYVNASLKIEIEYEEEITSILLNGNNIEIPEREQIEGEKKGKYILEIQVTDNGTYSIIAKEKNNKYNVASVKVTDITEDMDIYNAQDMVTFREKVNIGRTFKGRTVRLMNDINLKTVCGEEIGSWVPIGIYIEDKTYEFAGKFEGRDHNISNLYINTEEEEQGLFKYNVRTH